MCRNYVYCLTLTCLLLISCAKKLVHTIEMGNAEEAVSMIQKGADVNERDEQGKTPLMIALQKRQMDIVQQLLEHNADPTLRDYTHVGLRLVIIADNGDSTRHPYYLVSYSIRGGKRVNDFINRFNQYKIDKVYLNRFINIIDISYPGEDALMYAASYSNPTTIKTLIDRGASPEDGMALVRAAGSGQIENVKIILNYNISPNIAIDQAFTLAEYALVAYEDFSPLAAAVFGNRIEVVKLLLENGANPDKTYKVIYFLTQEFIDSLSKANRKTQHSPQDVKEVLMLCGGKPGIVVVEYTPKVWAEKNEYEETLKLFKAQRHE